MTEPIKPCPFCGSCNVEVSENDFGEARWVTCVDCETDGPIVPRDKKEKTHGTAIGLWNQRNGYDTGKRDLRDLLKLICPQIEPMESLSGMVSQINNFIACNTYPDALRRMEQHDYNKSIEITAEVLNQLGRDPLPTLVGRLNQIFVLARFKVD